MHRYYSQIWVDSQIWVVRVLGAGKVSQPLEHRKLLAVVETELGNRVAEASSWPSGAMISRKDSLLGLTTGCGDRGPGLSTALIASALAEACSRQEWLLGWPPLVRCRPADSIGSRKPCAFREGVGTRW